MKNLLIFSAERSNLNADDNKARTAWLVTILSDSCLSYERVLGSYRGVEETSFALPLNSRHLQAALLLASLFEQESLLEINSASEARLLCPRTGNVLSDLGRVFETKNPLAHDAWTFYRGLFYTTN